MSDKNVGLFQKYVVKRVDKKRIKGGGCLVLEYGDQNAVNAILQYAHDVGAAGYTNLRYDLRGAMIDIVPDAVRSFDIQKGNVNLSVIKAESDAREADKKFADLSKRMADLEVQHKDKVFDLERQVSGLQIQLDRANVKLHRYSTFIHEELRSEK